MRWTERVYDDNGIVSVPNYNGHFVPILVRYRYLGLTAKKNGFF